MCVSANRCVRVNGSLTSAAPESEEMSFMSMLCECILQNMKVKYLGSEHKQYCTP